MLVAGRSVGAEDELRRHREDARGGWTAWGPPRGTAWGPLGGTAWGPGTGEMAEMLNDGTMIPWWLIDVNSGYNMTMVVSG